MRYVLDASVALKWVVDEPDAAEARRIRNHFRNAVHELIAPDSFELEIAHSLTRAQRRGLIPDAWILWVDVMTTAPVLFPAHPLFPRAIQIATRARIGVYDCLYVALAEREACELVTADAGCSTAFSRPTPSSSLWPRCRDPGGASLGINARRPGRAPLAPARFVELVVAPHDIRNSRSSTRSDSSARSR
jgi:predicted nucleic acid-binding protein